MRQAEIKRKTNETDITLSLLLDGEGAAEISTGCGFLDHMLTLFAYHGGYDLKVSCKGDTYVDYHHTTEDIGIALGRAFSEALGDRRGIQRYGFMILPMDEALILTSVDISGRCLLNFDVDFPTEKVGNFDTELVSEFWYGFARAAELTMHIKMLDGSNSHHIAEGIFKSAARSLSKAVLRGRGDGVPSTKGVL